MFTFIFNEFNEFLAIESSLLLFEKDKNCFLFDLLNSDFILFISLIKDSFSCLKISISSFCSWFFFNNISWLFCILLKLFFQFSHSSWITLYLFMNSSILISPLFISKFIPFICSNCWFNLSLYSFNILFSLISPFFCSSKSFILYLACSNSLIPLFKESFICSLKISFLLFKSFISLFNLLFSNSKELFCLYKSSIFWFKPTTLKSSS